MPKKIAVSLPVQDKAKPALQRKFAERMTRTDHDVAESLLQAALCRRRAQQATAYGEHANAAYWRASARYWDQRVGYLTAWRQQDLRHAAVMARLEG